VQPDGTAKNQDIQSTKKHSLCKLFYKKTSLRTIAAKA